MKYNNYYYYSSSYYYFKDVDITVTLSRITLQEHLTELIKTKWNKVQLS